MDWSRGIRLNSAGTSLIVADQGNYRVDVFPVGSGAAQTFTAVDSVKNPNGLSYPFGVGGDAAGDIYVADFTGNQVIEMSGTGSVLVAYRTGLNQPTDVTFDSQGNLYILDLTKITKLGPGFSGTPVMFGNGAVSVAAGICVRGTDVFVADSHNNRVDWWTNSGAGPMSVVYTTPNWLPTALAFDATGRYAYLAEQANQLEVFDTTGGVWTKVAGCLNSNYGALGGVAVDGSGNFFLSETQNANAQKFGPIDCLPTPLATQTPANSGSNLSGLEECFVYPSPARGAQATVSYQMQENGNVLLKIWNEKAELVATVTDSKSTGVQTTPFSISGFATGVYFYSVVINYDSGKSEKISPQKFVILH
jgi:sugar lactone lactonase YvrE